jgi:hypothetical protein
LPPTICGSDGATDDDGPRHSAGWYRRTLGDRAARPGQPVMIRCVDGPVRVWLETFPPRLEIEGHGGVYVLVDDGPVHSWTYRFVTSNG